MDCKFISNHWFMACNGIICEANSEFLNLTGYTVDEIIGTEVLSLIHPGFVESFDNSTRPNKGEEKQFDIKLIKKNREEKWVRIFSRTSYVNNNVCICGLAYDITEEKLYIEKLEIVEAQYADILDNMSEEVSREDPNGFITYVNNAYCNFYGMAKDQAIGKKGTDVVIPEDRIKYKLIGELTPQNPFYKVDCRVTKTDGTIAWIQSAGRGFFNQKGEFVELQEVGRDVTELKRNEVVLLERKDELEARVKEKTAELSSVNQKLENVNNYLNNILQNISEGVAVFDEKGNIDMVNDSLRKSLKGLTDKLVSKFKNEIVEVRESPLRKLIYDKQSFNNYEIVLEKSNGNIQYLISGMPLEEKSGELKKGVFIVKPLSEVHKLVNQISGFQAGFNFNDIITKSEKLIKTIQYAQVISKNEMNILIEGESGTGKEMFAQSIHNHSERKKGPFIGVNCGAIPSELIGSELFGYSEGSFTGAKKGGKPGKFELANGGTIFLDEIADMPLAQQVALLRVLQEKKLIRIGGDCEIPVDARIICATNKDLLKEVQSGNFRQDLYYRLNVLSLKIPPLRERRNDIPVLLQYFYQRLKENDERNLLDIDSFVLDKLLQYDWPGNVRELQNILERSLYLSDGENILFQNLPDYIRNNDGFIDSSEEMQNEIYYANDSVSKLDLSKLKEKNQIVYDQQEKLHIQSLMNLFDNNISIVARKMNISRNTLYKKLNKYDIK